MNIHRNKKGGLAKTFIFRLIKEKKIITTSEAAGKLSCSWNTAEKYLLEIALENKIMKIKKSGVNLWILK